MSCDVAELTSTIHHQHIYLYLLISTSSIHLLADSSGVIFPSVIVLEVWEQASYQLSLDGAAAPLSPAAIVRQLTCLKLIQQISCTVFSAKDISRVSEVRECGRLLPRLLDTAYSAGDSLGSV